MVKMNKKDLLLKLLLIIFSLTIILNVRLVKIDGNSMKPTLTNGDIIFYSNNIKRINRFDIIIFSKNNEIFIKRVIGMPGDSISYKKNTLYVNNIKVEEKYLKSITEDFNFINISKDKYFVIGDNRLYSYDSRNFGLVDKNEIKGKMFFKIKKFL